jgi:DNA adenine methylase
VPDEINDCTENRVCQPFLKWAGGKRWLVTKYSHFVPAEYNRYIEPFLGSGAMFFGLQPRRAILSDLNPELIDTYRAIKNDWRHFSTELNRHHSRHSAGYYYRMRSSRPVDPIKRAARFLYLNRTCWNGLYRVNKQGDFNVPLGTKVNVCLPTDDFESVHRRLRAARLISSDFEDVVDMAKSEDFVFVDPPYTTLHSDNGFVKYNEKLFAWSDQIRLHDCLLRAKRRGVFIVATNADHVSIRALYSKAFRVQSLRRASVIASDSQYRKTIRELLITV